MKQGRSTSTPTKEEAERIERCKMLGCLCCWMIGYGWVVGDYHHLLHSGRRRGHMFGIALCPWHHRGYPLDGMTVPQTRELLGPSLMDGSKVFKEEWGDDDQLLAIQNQMLEAAYEQDDYP